MDKEELMTLLAQCFKTQQFAEYNANLLAGDISDVMGPLASDSLTKKVLERMGNALLDAASHIKPL